MKYINFVGYVKPLLLNLKVETGKFLTIIPDFPK